jgi:N,N'-diacetyllegionaminate synthase
MKTIDIAGRAVGDGHPCFVIAEAGSNHNGRLEEAKALIRIAADAGADAVKFQTFRAEKLYARNAGRSDYLQLDKPIFDIIAAMEMPYEWLPQLAEEAQRHKVLFLSTPFDEESADALEPYVPAYKIASYEMTHLPLVRYIAKKGKPLIISTGTANLDEVRETVAAVRATGNEQLVMLQCTASYPAPLDSLNLRAMTTMRSELDVLIGLSDHSREPLLGPIAAIALGACVIEKHFTFNNELPGPDHRFAIEPHELRAMIRSIRDTESALGTGEKRFSGVEEELRQFARRTILTTKPIASGELLTKDNIAVLRAGNVPHGLAPAAYDTIVGKPARRALDAGVPVTENDVA